MISYEYPYLPLLGLLPSCLGHANIPTLSGHHQGESHKDPDSEVHKITWPRINVSQCTYIYHRQVTTSPITHLANRETDGHGASIFVMLVPHRRFTQRSSDKLTHGHLDVHTPSSHEDHWPHIL
ncbi:hypothetical protein BJ138DRAFT_426176 [Hygrophoropsis aurantiaca]|uniref:Uncharacterized protein n=1 Tax=Hygrophoropsis aurantiaca TaxID=72124 RepID=A0ACB8A3E6_9AGAM|nr:hypothetical protein BJ138DRAFT_426176 [Hygrophoropsis aurantiaca]